MLFCIIFNPQVQCVLNKLAKKTAEKFTSAVNFIEVVIVFDELML